MALTSRADLPEIGGDQLTGDLPVSRTRTYNRPPQPITKRFLLGLLPALLIAPAVLSPASAPAESAAHARYAKRGHGNGAGGCAKHGKSPGKGCKKGAAGGSNALVTLTDPATGFRVRAPRDFTVAHTSKAVEHVSSRTRGGFVNYLLVQSAEAPAKVAQTLIAQSKSTVSFSTQSATSYTAVLIHGGHAETLEVRQVTSGELAVIAWGTSKAPSKHTKKSSHNKRGGKHSTHGKRHAGKASVARTAAAEPLGALLQRIANEAKGGKAVAAPVQKVEKPVAPVALQSFTNSDHSATAQVPAGFKCAGSRGIIECLDPVHGAIEFGVGMPVCVPGSTKAWTAEHVPGESALCPGISAFIESSSTAATTFWGPTLDKLINAGIANVTLVKTQSVPFEPGWNASFNLLRFTRNGVPWEAAMFAATTAKTGSAEEWLFYYSDVSAPQSGNSAYGQALAQSWASFNPSAAEGQRLAEVENDQKATTQVIDEANAFRQEVFDEANENWDAYIRGSNAAAGETAKEEIDEKTREVVGRAKEQIEAQLP
jgi:hypothetical protein